MTEATSSASVPLERLVSYQNAIVDLPAEGRLRLGDLLEKLPSTYRANLESDLIALGIGADRQIPSDELRVVLRRAAEAQFAVGRRVSPELRTPSGEELLEAHHEAAESTPRAAACEAAFDVASRAEHFLQALGWVVASESPYRHQLVSARRLVEDLSACGLVADEVGLGKTLVAGLAVFELEARGLIDSCLVLTPSNLLDQWDEELRRFFDGEFTLVAAGDHASLANLKTAPRVLMDLDRAKIDPFHQVVRERRWGCLIVDEAHRLRNAGTQRAKFCSGLNSDHRIYLTATPVHNSAWDVYHLVTQLRPGFFGARPDFQEEHLAENGSIVDPAGLQSTLRQTISRQRRADTDLEFPRRVVEPVWVLDRNDDERRFYRALLAFLRTVYHRYAREGVPLALPSGGERHVRSLVLVSMLLLRELASHPLAALATLGGSLREQIRRVDQLLGRSLVDLDQLDDLVDEFSGREWGPGSHAKSDLLVDRLPDIIEKDEKVIVYAEFHATLHRLEERIRQNSKLTAHPLVPYHGSLSRGNKQRALERFRNAEGPCIFLSTDCGGEGLNLQVAGAVINYDFPWNPMRIEQRIGRVDRIGQKRKEIHVFNMVTSGTIESYVYAVLEEKLRVCTDVMGEISSPISQLQLRRPEDFGIGALILGARDDEAMAAAFVALEEQMELELAGSEARRRRAPSRDVWF